MRRESCGSCHLCCDLIAVTALAKPPCQLCKHAEPGRPGGACTIYDTRPYDCREFRCLWLISQEDVDKTPMPLELRPDNSHVVFAGLEVNGELYENGTSACVDPAHPDAWREPQMHAFLCRLAAKGVIVALRCGDDMALLAKAASE